jgi:flavin reductase (DIM6/NTAB) family NADH-FMN oxidoreductase RutF
MSEFHFYEPSRGHGLKHDPFKAIIAPRPIGWISTVSPAGAVNLAPYSFFNGFTSSPPIIGFSSEKDSDSLLNARETGEFVYNMVGFALAEKMSATSYPWPRGVDEMGKAGIAAAPSRIVKAPRVAEAAAAMECKVVQIVHLHDMDGTPTAAHLVLGQVVGVHIDPQFLKDGIFDTAAVQPLARCGYLADYAVVTEMVKMKRPRDEAEATLG